MTDCGWVAGCGIPGVSTSTSTSVLGYPTYVRHRYGDLPCLLGLALVRGLFDWVSVGLVVETGSFMPAAVAIGGMYFFLSVSALNQIHSW